MMIGIGDPRYPVSETLQQRRDAARQARHAGAVQYFHVRRRHRVCLAADQCGNHLRHRLAQQGTLVVREYQRASVDRLRLANRVLENHALAVDLGEGGDQGSESGLGQVGSEPLMQIALCVAVLQHPALLAERPQHRLQETMDAGGPLHFRLVGRLVAQVFQRLVAIQKHGPRRQQHPVRSVVLVDRIGQEYLDAAEQIHQVANAGAGDLQHEHGTDAEQLRYLVA